MAHQARWRDAIIHRNAHNIRVLKDGRANDPTVTPDVRAHRVERLQSPLMAREHDNSIAHVPGALEFREACANDAEDVATFYGVKR
jgi:hypothetical protein